jgi:hypothetical protein
VEWAHQISIEHEQTMTIRELFAGVRLANGENYFLVISRLGVGETPRQKYARRTLRELYPPEAHAANGEAHVGTQEHLHTLLCNLKSICQEDSHIY